MKRRRIGLLVLSPILVGVLLMVQACDLSGVSSILPTIDWPFDTSVGTWQVFHGYHVADHKDYTLDSMDFVLTNGNTAGQNVLSPVSGTLVPFGPAQYGEGVCVSIGITDNSGYHLMVCHIDLTHAAGSVTMGDVIGTVHTQGDPPHIHITLYYLDPTLYPDDTLANAIHRQHIAFDGQWNIGGCNYPDDGSLNQWGGTTVPC